MSTTNKFHNGILFQFKKVTISDSGTVSVVANSTKDIESDFNVTGQNGEGRVGYVKCEGLFDKGKRKNAYTETYADSNRVRIYQDANSVTREATSITLTLAFLGYYRKEAYENVVSYVQNGIIEYFDDKRNKYAYMILTDTISPSEDVWKGSEPYIIVPFKFQSVYGNTFSSTLITT